MPTQTSRGHATRQGILEAATAIASVEGLEGLTLGRLATDLAMSKSGLFAHFGSKEELQLATIEHARQIYVDQVILPGLAHSSGIATLHAALRSLRRPHGAMRASPADASLPPRWLSSMLGPAWSETPSQLLQRQWLDMLEGAARDGLRLGELDRSVDPVQLAFELEAAMLSGELVLPSLQRRPVLCAVEERRATHHHRRLLLKGATCLGRGGVGVSVSAI